MSERPVRHPRAQWSNQRERGSYALIVLIRWLALNLPRGFVRLTLHPIALYFLIANRTARRASVDYFVRLGMRGSWPQVYRHFFTFASTSLDRVFFLTGRLDQFDVTVEGIEDLDAALALGRGCLLVGTHFGSFEVLRALGRRDSAVPVNVLMYEENARKIAGALGELNREAASRVIPLGQPTTMLRVREALDRGEIVGILADRDIAGEGGAEVPFLGAGAQFPVGHIRLAAALRVPMVSFYGVFDGGRRYRIAFGHLADGAELRMRRPLQALPVVRRHVAQLEARVIAAPYNWFNFYDFWRRG